MSAPDVVDACSLVYDHDCWERYLRRLAAYAPEYLKVFAHSFTRYFGADPEEFRRQLRHGPDRAVAVLLAGARPPFDLDDHLARRRAAGIVSEIAMGIPGFNERVAAFAAAAPGRIHAWAALSLRGDAAEAVAELKSCLDLGMTGLCIIPFLDGVDVLEPRFAPVFELAAAERLGLWLHSGHHFATARPLDISGWRQLDTLAGRYPELTIVAGHAGWPWVRECVAVASRHDNVMLEFSSHRAKHMPLPGSGWESLLFFAATSLKHKVMFGSSTWVSTVSDEILIDEVRALGLGPEVTENWLHGNARRLLSSR